MAGRECSGQRRSRMRWVGASVLGFGLMTPACGQTAHEGSSPGEGDAGSSPVALGGAPEDKPVMGGEAPIGGSATVGGSGAGGGDAGASQAGASSDAGAGGAPPEPRRPITAHVVDPVMGPVEGMKLYIAGETFVSDADGIVNATAPVGEYDAVVLDTYSDSGSDWATGIQVYQGLTTDAPVFSLPRDYLDQDMPPSSAKGAVNGSYPDGSFGQIGFDKHPAQLISMASNIEAGAYTATATWYVNDLKTNGNLLALLWSRDSNNRPTAFWFGQTPIEWGPFLPVVVADIDVAPQPSRPITLQINSPAGTSVSGLVRAGPFSWPAGADDSLGNVPYLVPQPNAQLPLSIELTYGPVSHESSGWIITRIPDNVDSIAPELPELPTLLEPADGVKKLAVETKFRFDAIPNTCHSIGFTMSTPAYANIALTLHTARDEFSAPDLGPSGPSWLSAASGRWSVISAGPCSSIDALVTPSAIVPDRSTWFSLGARTFTTAR